MQMSLVGKLEADVTIKADAAMFHNIFSRNPQQTAEASPDKILACDLKEGDWGNYGSIINWDYVHEGKAKTARAQLSVIDNLNKSTTYTIVGGDVMEGLKSFLVTVKATPVNGGMGSVVHWSLVYEKLNGDVPAPNSLIEYAVNVTKDIDAHLLQPLSA